MTPDLLRDIGRALFGERWETALADALGVSSRTIRYWLAGRAIPEAIGHELYKLMVNRHALLTLLCGKL